MQRPLDATPEHTHLAARCVGSVGLVCSQLAGTVGWWLTRLIFHQIGTHR